MKSSAPLAGLWDKVPKRLIVYWGRNLPLSWMRYMTVKSFVSLNPDWEVEVLTPHCPVQGRVWDSREFEINYNGKDWFYALDALPRVRVRWVNFSVLADPLLSEIHRSDYIRYSELVGGGVWSDMDVLYLAPIEGLEFSYMPSTENIDGAVCWYGKDDGSTGHRIGVLVGTEGSGYWQKVFGKAFETIHGTETEIVDYQHLGRDLLDKHFPWKKNGTMANIMGRSVYPVKVNALAWLYQSNPAMKVLKNAVGIHWYAGHARSGQAERNIVPGDMTLFSQLARRSL